MIVCKFGGSSVASKDGALNIKQIVSSNKNRKIVVVSALGKSSLFSKKVTDELYETYLCSQTDVKTTVDKINSIFKKYDYIAKELNLNIDFSMHKKNLIDKIYQGDISKEYLVSRGEYLSALLYSKLLGATFIDAKDYIIFNKNGSLNFATTKQRLLKLKKNQVYVIGGFYGATKKGSIKTFSRGGSDITGAIISKALNAEVYENYTDVNGVYDRNPNIFKNAKNLPLLNYKTACQMADCGNEVVHKCALATLKDSPTILIVKNTNNYNGVGTVVVNTSQIFNNLFVCVSEQKLLIFNAITKDIIQKLRHFADVKNIVKVKNKYYVFANDIFTDDQELQSRFNLLEYLQVSKVCLFSNVKIDDNCIKKLKKVQKKLKNHTIFANYLSFYNNFVIVCEQKNKSNTVDILNSVFL